MEFKIVFFMISMSTIVKLTTQSYDLSNKLLLQNEPNSNDNDDDVGSKRQKFTDPQGHIVPNAVLNIPVLTNIGFYPGNSEKIDNCDRDEVVVWPGDTCQKLLQRGSCKVDEFAVLDSELKSGYCAPRLCPPDRIFVHSTQQCHAPVDDRICPYGKELFYTAYGTAICDCPEGTVIGYDYNGGESCLPILSENKFCPKSQVQWFRDFLSSPSKCLPDPCQGRNLNRESNRFPFAPNESGQQCYQLGQTDNVCKSGLIYALHLPSLKGKCSSLQKVGYEVFTEREIYALDQNYGTNIVNRKDPFSSLRHDSIINLGEIAPITQPHGNHVPKDILPDVTQDDDDGSIFLFKYLHSLGIKNPQVMKVSEKPFHEKFLSNPYSRSFRSLGDHNTNNNTLSKTVGETSSKGTVLHREKRQDSPTTAMPTKLVNCKPGAERDVNGKCKDTSLGPASGSSGASSSPASSCPPGQSFNVKMVCASAAAQSSFG